jgi:hypothetical protein
MSEPSQELVVPVIGTVVNLEDVASCAITLDDIRELEWQLRQVKAALVEKLIEKAQLQGSKTLHFEGGKAEVRFGDTWTYDPEEIERGLREAGMPEDAIREIVEETVVYKVKVARLQRAAAANPAYAQVMEENRQGTDRGRSVSVSRGKSS